MVCQSCGQETEEGMFCTNCGAPLETEESAAATEPTEDLDESSPEASEQTSDSPEEVPSQTTAGGQNETAEEKEVVEQTKKIASDFGQLFVSQLKSPMNARNVNSTHLISGIITMVIFSLIIALNSYIVLRDMLSGPFSGEAANPFVDTFLLPFIQLLVLLGIVASLNFVATKLCNMSFNYTDIIAKYGAYVVPFLLLYAAGFIFSLINLDVLFTLAASISILGAVFIVPVVIILEKESRGIDQLYIIIGMSVVSIIAFGFLADTIMNLLFGNMIGGNMGDIEDIIG